MELQRACVFDINETLLNLDGLDSFFSKVFGQNEFRQIWFQSSLQASEALTLTDSYLDFSQIQESTLESLGEKFGIPIASAHKEELKNLLRQAPAFPDVRKGLESLRGEGYRIFALTNANAQTTTQLLEKNDLGVFFEKVFSVDSVQAFKPAPQVYDFVATELDLDLEDLWMIAAHDWDTHGAASMGMKTALLRRPKHGWNQCFLKPNVRAENLPDLVELIFEKDGVRSPRKHLVPETGISPKL